MGIVYKPESRVEQNNGSKSSSLIGLARPNFVMVRFGLLYIINPINIYAPFWFLKYFSLKHCFLFFV